ISPMSRLPLLIAVLAFTIFSAHAGSGLPETCAAAKQRAAAKRADSTLRCFAKATAHRTAIDQTCVNKAETKFTDAVAKVESNGGCVVTGDAAVIGRMIDAFVSSIAAVTPVTTTTTTTIICPTGETDCAGVCTYLPYDPENCGACGRRCRQGES